MKTLLQLLESFHYFVGKQARKVASSLNIEATPLFIEALAKVLLYQIKYLSTDLEAFSKHAKRSNINIDDLKLALRRNPSLQQILTLKLLEGKK